MQYKTLNLLARTESGPAFLCGRGIYSSGKCPLSPIAVLLCILGFPHNRPRFCSLIEPAFQQRCRKQYQPPCRAAECRQFSHKHKSPYRSKNKFPYTQSGCLLGRNSIHTGQITNVAKGHLDYAHIDNIGPGPSRHHKTAPRQDKQSPQDDDACRKMNYTQAA